MVRARKLEPDDACWLERLVNELWSDHQADHRHRDDRERP
jgi:hypothetical protein